MGVIPERAEESSCICMHHTVVENFTLKVGELNSAGESAIDEEVCTLKKRGLGGELFNRIASRREVGEE